MNAKIKSSLVAVLSLFSVLALGALLGLPNRANAEQAKPSAKADTAGQGSRAHLAAEKKEAMKVYKKLREQFMDFFKTFDSKFDEDFFSQSENPFEEMEAFRKEMRNKLGLNGLGADLVSSDHFFDAWFNNRFGGTLADIQRKEDENWVTYEIKVDHPKEYTFTTAIEDGMIRLSAERKVVERKKSKNYQQESSSTSTMVRSFPVPNKVDAKHFQTSIEGDEYIVKFPKKKSS